MVDPDDRIRLSVKVNNDEGQLTDVISKVNRLATQVEWAVDIIGAPSALLLTLLTRSEQVIRYASGPVVSAMSAGYTGEGKTGAKDSYVIAETARIRGDLTVIDRRTELVRKP